MNFLLKISPISPALLPKIPYLAHGLKSKFFYSFPLVQMKLLTKALLKQFAKVGDQSHEANPLIICKFFHPCSSWTRYASKYNEEQRIFFGYVVGHFPERGTFSLDELENVI